MSHQRAIAQSICTHIIASEEFTALIAAAMRKQGITITDLGTTPDELRQSIMRIRQELICLLEHKLLSDTAMTLVVENLLADEPTEDIREFSATGAVR